MKIEDGELGTSQPAGVDRLSCSYNSVRRFARVLIHVLFKKVELLHTSNIPREGPLIIVANHNNQFIDPTMVLKAVQHRPVRFIIAEKSMHKLIVGDFARAMKAVPVIRPQDRAKTGSGKITDMIVEQDNVEIVGEDTKFTEECTVGFAITIKGVGTLKILEIISDTQLRMFNGQPWIDAFNEAKPKQGSAGFSYKVTPKINQDEVYEAVHDVLLKNSCIGIFPEGGSHDQTHLLKLKPGVAVMALGALAKGADVQILPIGINYFSGHQFRSNVIVECGIPFRVSPKIFDLYQSGEDVEEQTKNRRAAYVELMQDVQNGLELVTLNAPNYRVLTVLRTMRRLYQGDIKLPLDRYMQLYRRFVSSYPQWKEDPGFQDLEKKIKSYLTYARGLGLTDKQVQDLPASDSCSTVLKILLDMIFGFFLVLVLAVIFTPALILNLPLTYKLETGIRREMKRAKAGSSVKNKALDVASSQRVLITLKIYPILVITYTILAGILLFFFWPYEGVAGEWHDYINDNIWWIFPLFFFVVFPLYTYFSFKYQEIVFNRYKRLGGQIYVLDEIRRRKCGCNSNDQRKYSLSTSSSLRLRRRNLAIMTQRVIIDLTHNDPIWQEDPILSVEELMAQRDKETATLINHMKRTESLDPLAIEEALKSFQNDSNNIV